MGGFFFVVVPALLLLAAVTIAVLFIRRLSRQQRVQRIREQARLRVIEGQLATLRALLRIAAAEQHARWSMNHQATDLFANHTDYEEYRSS